MPEFLLSELLELAYICRATETSGNNLFESQSDDSFPGSPKFDDDGFGDVVSMNGMAKGGDAWGTQSAHDDDAWENKGADDFGEPFYS